jgi:membrane protein
VLDALRLPAAMLLLTSGLLMAHRVLPARSLRFRDILPGVLLTTIVWFILSTAFSAYLVNFNTFASTYASLSGVFAAMFFLYLAALVMIFGGELNRVLMIHREFRAASNAKTPDISPE